MLHHIIADLVFNLFQTGSEVSVNPSLVMDQLEGTLNQRQCSTIAEVSEEVERRESTSSISTKESDNMSLHSLGSCSGSTYDIFTNNLPASVTSGSLKVVLMYRKLSLSIIDNFAIFGVIELITHDNLLIQYLNKIPGFQPKVNIFLKNSIFKKEPNPMFGVRKFWKNCSKL
jgi:hypothetical protein